VTSVDVIKNAHSAQMSKRHMAKRKSGSLAAIGSLQGDKMRL
jgi:hypothetical protein